MVRFNVDRFSDDNPQEPSAATNAPSVARRYSRRSWTAQVNHHVGHQRESSPTRRAFAYLHGDPVTSGKLRPYQPLHTRWGCAVHHWPTRASNIFITRRVVGHPVVVAWQETTSFRRKCDPSHLRRTGSEPAPRSSARSRSRTRRRRPSVNDTKRRAELHAADQLRHQQLHTAAVLYRVRTGSILCVAT